ncbi:MAG: transposase [Chloroflexi bacterium]|nr:transposase [Chloroflexota bacterium]MCI0581074.1 transposase [Chloroflexota bacterium]MCI0649462.1 transposase [Chloroflexota bacterium]MCI0731867.1 transposase [Chloroflexota bacterium]
MDKEKCIKQLEQFRQRLYQNFNNRADTLMELVDAISSNRDARSVVEYSLSPCFRRSYSTIFKALAEMDWEELSLPRLLAGYLPQPEGRAFWLWGVDVTPQPRQFAPTLRDRSVVYQANPVSGNKPITIGHQYSTVALLPEAEAGVSSSWVVPLLTRRVHSDEDKELVGAGQIAALLTDEQLPYRKGLCVEVGDTSYSKPAYLCANRQHDNLVTITRVRGNRTFYRAFVAPDDGAMAAGHPTWYGAPFSLPDPTNWPEPDELLTRQERSRRGKVYRVEVRAWHNMLMSGQHKPARLPMHLHPFMLVQVVRYDEHGRLACKRPLWLLVIGPRRQALTLAAIYQAYGQRFDLEHFFRFGKQKLLLADCQTPEEVREESWWQLVHIAYAQLWLARHVAQSLPRPWERHLPAMKARQLSPALVQRDFGRIIRQIGTPAQPPQPRGISPGRPTGTKLPPRPRYQVVIKGRQLANSP